MSEQLPLMHAEPLGHSESATQPRSQTLARQSLLVPAQVPQRSCPPQPSETTPQFFAIVVHVAGTQDGSVAELADFTS